MSTIRCILAIASNKGWPIYQLGVNNTSLHGDLHEMVYMKVLEGLSCSPGSVGRLRKSLY